MKVLITGGGGDVGIALSERLATSGHGVVAYDLKGSGLPDSATFIEGDVRDFSSLAGAAAACDAGIHLAAAAGDWTADEMMSVNVLGAYGFLLAAKEAQFRNSVIASSAPVHLSASELDDGLLLRTSHDDDHVYDLTKTIQEAIGRDFHAHGLPVLCIRFGHIVLGKDELNLKRTMLLKEEDYCRGGWVALEDIVDACAAGLEAEPAADTFEILNIVGAKGARERFCVGEAEERLGIKLRYDFAAYE